MARRQCSPEEFYITTVKLGPKGQIVIPKEIRSRCGIRPGENLILVSAPDGGFMVLPADRCRGLAAHLLTQLPGLLDAIDSDERSSDPC